MNRDQIEPYIALEELLDTLQIQVWGMSDERTYAYANAAHAAFLGKARKEIEQQDVKNLFSASVADLCIANYRTAYQTRKPVTCEEWTADSNGTLRLLRIVNTPKLDESGRVSFVSCVAEDITERRQMEQDLKRNGEHLEEMVQDKVQDIADALWGTINSLVRLAETRDDIAGGHLRRLSDSCRVVASVLSFNSVYSEQINYEFIVNIQQASLLHDIGKVGIPDSILLKPGKLLREEFEEMKKHTTIGAQTLAEACPRYQDNSIFKMAIEIASSHHERWDGKGYPQGLKGEQIPLSAQIVSICDAYDALRTKMANKPAYSHEESLTEIRRECGTHFSHALCDAFFHCAEEIRHVYDSYLI